MNSFPSRLGTIACGLAAGLGATVFLPDATAQTVDAAPTAAAAANPPSRIAPAADGSSAAVDPAMATGPAHPDAKGRHLAPPGTFYLLTYVSATTHDGVEGFVPGQEVHLVEAHRATHTLVVSDGHAQVEVPPSKLTHDMDVAALVRQKDEANQAQVAAYTRAEQAAYDKFERTAADATARDLAQRRQEQAAEAQPQPAAQPQADPSAPQDAVAADDGAVSADGYYGYGGYGYGSPYSYFVERPVGAGRREPAAAPAAAPAALPGKVAAPEGHAGGGRPK